MNREEQRRRNARLDKMRQYSIREAQKIYLKRYGHSVSTATIWRVWNEKK